MDGLFTAINDFLNSIIPVGASLQLGDSFLALNELISYLLVLGLLYWLIKKFIKLFGGNR